MRTRYHPCIPSFQADLLSDSSYFIKFLGWILESSIFPSCFNNGLVILAHVQTQEFSYLIFSCIQIPFEISNRGQNFTTWILILMITLSFFFFFYFQNSKPNLTSFVWFESQKSYFQNRRKWLISSSKQYAFTFSFPSDISLFQNTQIFEYY